MPRAGCQIEVALTALRRGHVTWCQLHWRVLALVMGLGHTAEGELTESGRVPWGRKR